MEEVGLQEVPQEEREVGLQEVPQEGEVGLQAEEEEDLDVLTYDAGPQPLGDPLKVEYLCLYW